MRDAGPREPELHRAAREGDIEAMRLLVGRGADVNEAWFPRSRYSSFAEGVTPLMVAAASCDGADADTVRWLLANGSDLRATSRSEVTAGWYGAGGGDARLRVPGRAGGDADRLRVLFDAGAEPAEAAPNQRSVLSEACRAGDPERVALVLGRGVDPTVFRPTQRRPYAVPLFMAAVSGSGRCVELLLDAGTPVDSADEQGRTALMQAGSVAVARVLLDAGADVHAVHRHTGEDALGAAIDRFKSKTWRAAAIEVADLLLEHGAELDLEATRHDGFSRGTRVRHAVLFTDVAAFDYLVDKGALMTQPGEEASLLHAAVFHYGPTSEESVAGTRAIIDRVVRSGGDVNAVDARGRTPLHQAVGGDGRNGPAVEALIDHGADVDLPDHDGVTPLMHLLDQHDLPADDQTFGIARTLVANGADPHRKDDSDRSASNRASEAPGLTNLFGQHGPD